MYWAPLHSPPYVAIRPHSETSRASHAQHPTLLWLLLHGTSIRGALFSRHLSLLTVPRLFHNYSYTLRKYIRIFVSSLAVV